MELADYLPSTKEKMVSGDYPYKSQNSKIYAIVLIILILLKGFELSFLPQTVNYLVFFLMFFWGGLNTKWKIKTPFTKPIIIFAVFLTLSFIYSYFVHKQNPIRAITNSYMYYGLFSFFVLLKYQLSVKETEKVLVLLSIIYCTCYIIQYLVYPFVIFKSAAGDINITDTSFRMRLTGSMFAYILLFVGFNKFLLKRKIKYILLSVIGFIPIIIMGFRSLIFSSVIAIIVMIPFVIRSTFRTLLFASFSGVLLYGALQTELVNNKLDEMMSRQEAGGNFNNEDYIRYVCLAHYWSYFDHSGEKIIGAGLPADLKSRYCKDIHIDQDYYKLYWMDLGLVGLWFMIGVPAVLLLLYIYIYSIWHARSIEIQYIRFCMLVILIGSIFTTMELYRPGNFIILSFLIYIVYKKQEDSRLLYT